MANRIIEINDFEKITDAEANRIFHDVIYQAGHGTRRYWTAGISFGILSILVGGILGYDYSAARVMFEYMDPTLGGISLGPEVLALSVVIAVVAVHLLITEGKGHTLEYRLKRLAGVGVIVFLLGMAMMFGLVLFDNTEGIGSSDQAPTMNGTIGNDDIGIGNKDGASWILSAFRAVFASISPIIFFGGQTLILFVSVYVSHRLLLKIEEHYEFLAKTDIRQARELKAQHEDLEELILEIEILDAERDALKEQLPRDPEKRFAQIASAAVYGALHRMNKALNGLGEPNVLLKEITRRKATIPPYITTRKQGLPIIAEIRHSTSPYAILMNLSTTLTDEEEG